MLGVGQLVSLVILFASGGFLDWYPSRLGDTATWIDDHLLSVGRPLLDADQGGSQLAAGATYALGLLACFAVYGAALNLARRIGAGTSRHLAVVWVVAALAALFLLWQPYLSSQDIFSYALYSRVWSIYGGNPLVETPRDYPFDPLFGAVFWKDQPSNYGPLWTYLSGLAVSHGASSVAETLVFHKALIAISVLLGIPLLWSALGRIAPAYRLSGTLLFAWSPLLGFESFGNGHNDAVMVFFVLAGIWLASRRLTYLAIAAFVASALVKYVSLVVLPLYVVAILRAEPDWRARIRLTVRAGTLTVVLLVLAFLPVYRGTATLQVFAFGSTPLAYTNTPLEIVFRELRVLYGESREAASLPLRFRAWWGEARSPSVFWTKIDQPDAVGIGLAEGDPVMVVEPQLLRWYHVYEPTSGLFGYVPATDVVRAPPPPAGYLAGQAAAGIEDVTSNPITQRANFTLRLAGMLVFAGLYLGLLLRVALARRDGIGSVPSDLREVAGTSLAALLASYWLIEMWFWPWYLIWALPFAAISPNQRLSRILIAFTLTGLVLNVQASLDIAPFLAPLYEYRSLIIFGLPLAWAGAGAGRLGTPIAWRPRIATSADSSIADSQRAPETASRGGRSPAPAHVGHGSRRWAIVALSIAAALGLALLSEASTSTPAGGTSQSPDERPTVPTEREQASIELAWQTAYDTGRDRITERRFAEAEVALTRAAEMRPNVPTTYRTRAEVYLQLERWDAAIADLTRIIKLEGESSEVLLMRGDAWARRQRYDLAIADYSKAIRLDPSDHRPRVRRAAAYHAIGALESARAEIRRALDIYPNDARAYQQLGDVLAAMADWRQATTAYDRAVALDRTLAPAFVGRAVVTRLSWQYFQTIPDLEQVLALSPDLNEQEWARQQLRSLADQIPGNALKP